jgi:Flp pilus assembly protein TadG
MRKFVPSRIYITTKPATARGQAAVEFALTLMVFLVLIFGILEASRLIFINSSVENGAREGAHFLSTNPGASDDELRAVVLSKMTLVNGADVMVTKAVPNPICDFCPLTVTVSYPWGTVVPILNFGTITLQSSSTRLIENSR